MGELGHMHHSGLFVEHHHDEPQRPHLLQTRVDSPRDIASRFDVELMRERMELVSDDKYKVKIQDNMAKLT